MDSCNVKRKSEEGSSYSRSRPTLKEDAKLLLVPIVKLVDVGFVVKDIKIHQDKISNNILHTVIKQEPCFPFVKREESDQQLLSVFKNEVENDNKGCFLNTNIKDQFVTETLVEQKYGDAKYIIDIVKHKTECSSSNNHRSFKSIHEDTSQPATRTESKMQKISSDGFSMSGFEIKEEKAIIRKNIKEIKKYQCDQCHEKFLQIICLKKHSNAVHKRKYESCMCTECHKMFSRKSGLLIHINAVHKKIGVKCNECDKIFSHKNSHRIHFNSVHKKIRYKCNECQKIFFNKCHLLVHTNSMHKKIHHKCNECHKLFTQKSSLLTHVKSVHNKIHFTCNECKKIFSRKDGLLVHINSKHKKLGYKCSECLKVFSKKYMLIVHINGVHNKMRRECNVCHETFSTKSSLYRHFKRLHLKVKHECKKCHKLFSGRRFLKDHNNSVHKKIYQMLLVSQDICL